MIISCCGRNVNYVTIVTIKRLMKCKKVVNSQSKAENSVLTGASESNSGERNEYMNGVNKLIENRSNSQIVKTMQNASESKISKNYIRANYEEDRHLQKMMKLVKSKDAAQIARLPVPWREKFTAFNLDSNNLLYINERLVIPKNMQLFFYPFLTLRCVGGLHKYSSFFTVYSSFEQTARSSKLPLFDDMLLFWYQSRVSLFVLLGFFVSIRTISFDVKFI